MSNQAKKRDRKGRGCATKGEGAAFKQGALMARDEIGPAIWKRAAIRSGLILFVLGLCVGGAIGHYFS